MKSDVFIDRPRVTQDLPSINILGIRVHCVTMQATLSCIEEMVLDNRPHDIITVNPEMIMTAQQQPTFKEVLNNASLVIPDGTGILFASWIFGHPITERVTGIDTTKQFAAIARQRGFRIFLLGAAPGVAEKAAQRLQNDYPGVQIVGTYAGSPHPDEEKEIFRRIKEANPHMLLVAYGAPKSELWAARHLQTLNVPVIMGVGGTFDFIAGIVPRAPVMIRNIGLEWLYRLVREPHRWQRMLALPRFAFAVILARLKTLFIQA